MDKHYIGGEWVTPAGGGTTEHYNPADLGEVTGAWPNGSEDDVARAIEAAAAAFPAWKATPAVHRGDRFLALLAAMDRRREEIARLITLENGKTLKDSRAEVQSSIREVQHQVGEGVRMLGRTHPSTKPDVLAYEKREPLGVVGIISPWNFPFNVPCRKVTPALMAGNSCILKPSGLTPGVAAIFAELFEEAEFPPGVFNVVFGGGSKVGNALVQAPHVRAVSFTGSTEIGKHIHAVSAPTMTRTQLEMGGKNPLVVLADADLDAAAEAAVTAGYACAGQWCTATSRVIVEASVAEELTRRILARVAELRVGNGLDESMTMGPVCGIKQVETISGYLEIGRKEGAIVAAGGERLSGPEYDRGCFIAPTVFTEVTPEMTIAREEIFGPVLAVIPVSGFEEAVTVANNVDFGLTSSVYTRDLAKAMRFVDRIETGMVHVNIMTAHREPAFSFGGVKDSGFGLPEAGQSGIEFFTEHKVVYVGY
ncbi:MAG: aldehyde dehydrogenase family protein [Spirochaetaceae bacterium]